MSRARRVWVAAAEVEAGARSGLWAAVDAVAEKAVDAQVAAPEGVVEDVHFARSLASFRFRLLRRQPLE